MKQLLQSLKTGQLELVDCPLPNAAEGQVLIESRASLISAGTERMLLDFGRGSYLGKARQQPDKVRQVLDKVKTDGLLPTLEAVRSRLDDPMPLGYCNLGRVLEAGPGVEGLGQGDLVVSNGPHAEVVCVPRNLCSPVPEGVGDHQAAYTVLAAVGLQGIRLAQPTLGERFAVFGLGLIGLITVQLLQAQGCGVLGLDTNPARCRLAEGLGAEVFCLTEGGDPLAAAAAFSAGRGVDGALITAATDSDQPVRQAARMCRQRGRLVLVGTAGLKLDRTEFYKKELTFQVSCSYGPGRYDPSYEDQGNDYPFGLVRWTEQRNFEAVLDLMSRGALDTKPLTSHVFNFESADKAYDLIAQNNEPYLGIILEYEASKSKAEAENGAGRLADTVLLKADSPLEQREDRVVAGVIGAGNFSSRVLIPALKDNGAVLKGIASSGGLSAAKCGRKFGFQECTTDLNRIFEDPEINTVFAVTRHNTHAGLVLRSLEAGKHVFTEKPLCISHAELEAIEEVVENLPAAGSRPLLMVGFNRRFAPQADRLKSLLDKESQPAVFSMMVNAGTLPPDHWTLNPGVGGGRLIGEACHFIDLLRFLAGSSIQSVQGARIGRPDISGTAQDKLMIQLAFANGSLGSIQYLANGHKSFPKERLEVFCGGKIIQLDNFRVMKNFGWPEAGKSKLWRQDKGHAGEISAWLEAIQSGGPPPIPWPRIREVTMVSLDLARGLEQGPVFQKSYGPMG